MKTRIVSLVVCVMFLTGFANAFSVEIWNIGEDFDIYVDDDNIDGPWDGTIEHPYQYIQDAIDNASIDDIIYVFSGVYNGRINVNKTISLIGEDKNTTIINIGLKIDAYYVNITGFTIQNGSWGSGGFYIISSYCKIIGNIITNCGDGIALIENTHFNVIADNIISNNCRGGIDNWFGFSNNNIIKRNTIKNNWFDGIALRGENNNISDNIIIGNDVGIRPQGSNTTIYDNIISNNKREGIYLRTSEGIYIYKNDIENNGGDGIFITGVDENIISGNTLTNNKNGIILTRMSKNNTINFNSFSDQNCGIWMVLFSDNNHISNNNFINNLCGLYQSGSAKNNITFNNFRKNKLNAFFLNCNQTVWDSNFWNRPRLLPKPILGFEKYEGLWIPSINYDYSPAQKPNDIDPPLECGIE
jgi:nitrous oxidase accessory protein